MIVRMKYSKTVAGRFLSHLDLLRTFERVFRRACLPLAFSEGFNPHPKISYGSALAVGVTSDGEYLDVEFTEELSLNDMMKRLLAVLPPGLQVLELQRLDTRVKSLTAVINMARYRVEVALRHAYTQDQIDEVIGRIMSEPELVISRDRKKDRIEIDIKKGIYALRGFVTDRKLLFEMELQTGSDGNVRPEEIVELIKKFGNIDMEEYLRIHRQGLYIRDNTHFRSPMEI